NLVASVLEEKGYTVLLARDGEEAVRVHRENLGKIDFVITDIGLPKLDGWEASQRMKQIDAKLKVFVASGYLDPVLKSEMLKAGSVVLLRKPYSPNEILRSLRRALEDR
ncbi:MAG TPA: hybrid sensor histidine kinase/response regulator, partial [Bacteroidetes bacterium]|nr:hybrid sensor histidine kinase/response regulator [Bacteroidota bacterium]